MRLSDFGNRLTLDAGILQLMDDLGRAMAGGKTKAMFGGGNPAQIPAVAEYYERELLRITQDPLKVRALLGNYDTPQGNQEFIETFVGYINRLYGWGITTDNVAITPGSQTGFFMLFNMLAGVRGGRKRKILLPIVPEYIGYSDQLIEPDSFVSVRPKINKIGEHEFKYKIDFDNLVVDESVAGIALSRPTNPTGNTVTNSEIKRLAGLAKSAGVPLIIDNAYGLPFPGVISSSAKVYFDDNTVLSFSLSKLGLPSARVGIFVGPPDLMRALSSATAIVSLASPSYGQYITRELFASDKVNELSRKYIQPFYRKRAAVARQKIVSQLPDDLPWRLHKYEGSYFFWLWLDGAKKSSLQIYDYLKKRGVVVVPGEYFFPGQEAGDWAHMKQCLRLNYSRPDEELDVGTGLLSEAVAWAYK